MENENQILRELFRAAWRVRERAVIFGETKVGCSVLAENHQIHSACNVEHRFRSHDIHAEVNAISSMVASGVRRLRIVAIVAERERFTPCGACMDWIMQFGGDQCLVLFQNKPEGEYEEYRAGDLMPHYPH